jgi:aquaglyceroporin related protein, other eukaryote
MGVENQVEHKEHHEPSSASSSDNSPENIYFEPPTMKTLPGEKAAPHMQQEHGPLVDHDIHPQLDELPSHPELWWSKVRATCQEAFSEFFGVFILILFGDGVVAQVVLSSGTKGSYQSISWGQCSVFSYIARLLLSMVEPC